MRRLDRVQLQREYRLLGKLLDQVEEGQIAAALQKWRANFGRALGDHKRQRREQQKAHEAWLRQPEQSRHRTPEPAVSGPGAQITDRNGYVWVIDDRYLAMMDNLIERMGRWMESEESQ
jgi:hypothetical protein